jgi:hypothetical protein
MLKTADSAFTRFDAWDRWSVSQPQHRPFDIREYTTGVKELTGSLEQMNDVIHSSNDLLASAEWGRRIGDVNQSADGRVRTVAQQTKLLIDTFYRRLYLAMGAFFAMLVLYRVTSLLLTRRLGIRGQSAAGPKQGNGHERSSSGTVHRPSRKETPG